MTNDRRWYTGKPRAQERNETRAWQDDQPAVARCALCPSFAFAGSVAECRDASVAHRAEHHPETVGRPSRRRVRELERTRKEADALERRARIEERYA